MITTIIYNSKLFERSSHQYVIIMITDIAQVVYSNHKLTVNYANYIAISVSVISEIRS